MKNQILKLIFGALLAVLLVVGAAHAQVPNLASLTGATTPDDWSMRLWTMLLGTFARDPFSTLGAPTTLLGSIFIVFNSCIFAVGVAWALYGVMGGVVATASEGEVLGKRMSTVWFPIRMITGIAGMVPIFGGFTLTQAVMMLLTTIGIGIGNTMWVAAVTNTSNMQGLLEMPRVSPTSSGAIKDAASSMFLSNVCVIAQNESVQALGARASTSEQMRVHSQTTGATTSYQYGSAAEPIKCGTAGLEGESSSRGGNFFVNAISFRSGAVQYDNIANAANVAYSNQLAAMQTSIAALATTWYQQREVALGSVGAAPVAMPVFPLAQVDQIVENFKQTTTASIAGAIQGQPAIQQDVEANMLRVGWLGAGAWSSTFAEVNAAIADAAKGPTVKADLPGAGFASLSSEAQSAVQAAQNAFINARTAAVAGTSSGDPTRALIDSAIEDVGCGGALNPLTPGVAGTATGNCSLGQGIVSAAIRGSAIGSGGGGGGPGLANAGLVNPVIMMKNMGDYVMNISSGILFADSALGILSKIPGVGSIVGQGASIVGSVAARVLPSSSSDGGMWAVMKTWATVTLVLGAAMSIYIPLIPFIVWMGAILAYAASMIEGLAGAPLHALAHLDGDGEGLGQRTTHGYMFYINALARPALMIIGFFVATAVMIAIGTLQAQMFLPAMANVQGNSTTGFFSVVMFLVIFFVINMTLITASYNLIYVITDQVIGFVGGQVDSKLGRDTEDKANNMFLMAARVGPSGMGQAAAAKGAAQRAAGEQRVGAAAKAAGPARNGSS